MNKITFGIWIAGLAIASAALGIPTETPDYIRKKYAYLYKETPVTNADGSVSFHHAKYFKRAGLNILSLRGDRYEMAYQHGRLLRKEILLGALPQASVEFENSLRNGLPGIPLVTNIIVRMLERKYPDAILESGITNGNGTVDQVLQEGYGLSDGSTMELQDILHGMVNPESLQVFVAEHLGKQSLLSRIVTASAFPSSCSAFTAWGDATADGEMIIGRNTDYPLNGYYDKYPTVFYYQPTDGTQKYMAVTSAGLHNSGVVGFNESGIYLGVHTVPTTAVSTEGVPVFMLAQEVLRSAHNFDEALKLFAKRKPAAGWIYMLVSTKEKRVASIELNAKNMAVLESVGTFHVQTNHYRSETLKPTYLHINVAVDDDTHGRRERVEELLTSSQGTLDVDKAMAILGDKYDPFFKKVRGVGNVVSVHTTMTSVVFQPGADKLFVASGQAPVSTTKYVELPVVAKFNPDTFSEEKYVVKEGVGYAEKHPEIAKAEQFFIKAKITFESELNSAKAYHFMKQALALDAENPAYHFVAGILALKAKRFGEAEPYFTRIANSEFEHYALLGLYYEGRVLAHNGNKAEARKRFEALKAKANSPRERLLKAAAEESLRQVSKSKYKINPATLALMMQQADMVNY